MNYLTHLWEGRDRTWGRAHTLILLPWASRLCAGKILDGIFLGLFGFQLRKTSQLFGFTCRTRATTTIL